MNLFKLLFFFLFVLLVRFILRLLLGRPRKIRPQGPRSSGRRVELAGRMFKDPQCGMYVASELAVTARQGPETLYFCSPQCRDRFLREHRQSAS